MSVFKTYTKVLFKNSAAILVYIFIFAFIAILNTRDLSAENKKAGDEQFNTPIGIINESDSNDSAKLCDYLKENYRVKKVVDNPQKIRESIVSEYVSYILKIKKDGSMEYYCNGNNEIEMSVNEKIKLYTNVSGMLKKNKVENADRKTEKILNSNIKTNYYSGGSVYKDKIVRHMYSYYNFGLFVMTFVLVYAGYQTQSKFKESEILNRIKVSSNNVNKFKMKLFKSYFVSVLAIWVLFTVFAVSLYGYKNMMNYGGLEFIIASFVYLIPVSAIACIVSEFVKNDTQASILINSGCMVFSFISGVFVPSKYLPGYVEKISAISPMYWSSLINKSITENSFYTSETAIAIAIQLLMAAVLILIYMAMNRGKRSKAAQ